MYEVGHNTVTFIIDKNGNKRLVYTGSDWSTADFMEDLSYLLHDDSSTEATSDEQSDHGH
jgi:cytochrome oxidase Cu insertion factor (SCO1/SenC/PrrC family)